MEAAFAGFLKCDPETVWFRFEGMRLRLGPGAWYKPDFPTINTAGEVVIYETKGRWMEAARVRIKVAAETYWMFKFIAVQRDGKSGWKFEEVTP